MSKRTAVLVDGENITANFANNISQMTAELGFATVQRVYGNAAQIPKWCDAPGFKLIHSGTGKNSADICMTIDAMEFCLQHGFENFVIVSADGDFTHLATRLREQGRYVLGLGDTRAPAMFRAACSRFAQLDMTQSDQPAATPPKTPDVDEKIRRVIAANSKKGEGVQITQLNGLMQKTYGIRVSELDGGSWRGYLTKKPEKYDLDPKGPHAKVRYRPTGFAS